MKSPLLGIASCKNVNRRIVDPTLSVHPTLWPDLTLSVDPTLSPDPTYPPIRVFSLLIVRVPVLLLQSLFYYCSHCFTAAVSVFTGTTVAVFTADVAARLLMWQFRRCISSGVGVELALFCSLSLTLMV